MSRPVILKFLGDSKQLDRVFGEVQRKAGKTGGGLHKLGQVGKAALLGVGGAALAVGTFSLKMAGDYETAHAKLSTALENTGTNFGAVRGQVDKLVKSGQGLGYNAGEIEQALGQLTTSTGDVHKAIGAMGIAEDLAAQKGIPLADAALAVGKAATGQLRPLKQLGIDLPVAAGGALRVKKAQDALAISMKNLASKQEIVRLKHLKGMAALGLLAPAMDKVKVAQNKLSTAQKAGGEILGALGSKLDGAASRQAETFHGKIKALKAGATNLGIKIGLWLIPKILELAHFIQTKVVPAIRGVIDWFDKHQSIALTLAAAIGGPLVLAIGLMTAAWIADAAAMIAANAPIIALVAAVALVAAGIVYLWTHWNQIWKWIQHHKAYAAIIAIVFPIIPLLLLIVGTAKYLHEHWKAVWSGVQKAVRVVWSYIGPTIKSIGKVIKDVVKVVTSVLSGDWGNAWKAAKKLVGDVVGGIINFFVKLPAKLGGKVLSGLVAVGKALGKGLANGVIWAINQLIDFIDSFKIPALHLDLGPVHLSTPGWGGFGIGHVPSLAKGGVFDSPTFALIGEASTSANREIATPEKLLREIVRGESGNLARTRQGVHVENLHVSATNPRAAARIMIEELAWMAKTAGH